MFKCKLLQSFSTHAIENVYTSYRFFLIVRERFNKFIVRESRVHQTGEIVAKKIGFDEGYDQLFPINYHRYSIANFY